jgi:EAL and modified HD-GYP domain-containing signal transduction protein
MTNSDVNSGQPLLGRQPILDIHEKLFGYRLAYTQAVAVGAADTEVDVAEIRKRIDEFRLAETFADLKGFMVADSRLLFDPADALLPAGQLVFSMGVDQARVPGIIEGVRALGQAGFEICVDIDKPTEFSSDEESLLDLGSYVNADIHLLEDVYLRELLHKVEQKHIPAIAGHVDTHADHERALKLGFPFFQGHYFAEPVTVHGKTLDPSFHALVRILNLLNRDADLPEIERIFKGEPVLTFKLLRLTNSASIGVRVRISSVRQAINLIGRRALSRWVQLLMFSRSTSADDIERNPLMQLAALKAYFMERLARLCFPQQSTFPDMAFLAGLMSLVPIAIGVSMETILSQIEVAPKVRQALFDHTGEIGVLLDLTESYDNNDQPSVINALGRLGYCIGPDDLNHTLVEAITWVQGLAVENQ